MSPTITIDDEVFAYLQERASAFVDTPNSVLRRELGFADERRSESATAAGGAGTRRMRRDAAGMGDDDRYLRGMQADIYVDGKLWRRSGVRSPRGADLNQIQTWIAGVVGSRDWRNADAMHKLKRGSRTEKLANVEIVVSPQGAGSTH